MGFILSKQEDCHGTGDKIIKEIKDALGEDKFKVIREGNSGTERAAIPLPSPTFSAKLPSIKQLLIILHFRTSWPSMEMFLSSLLLTRLEV
jgi:hypothetical protein